jgi:hypothetical protein
MRARFLIAVGLVVASTFAARPAGAQVGGQMNASPNPFEYEDDYVSVWFVASWDTSVFCGVDGGCQDVWCDADYVDVNINDGEFTYVDCPGPGCYGPSPGDGWFSIGFDDYGPPYAMQDAWYFGEANVHWSNGSFSYGTSGGDVVQARAAYNWQCGQGDVGRAKLIGRVRNFVCEAVLIFGAVAAG